MKVVIVGAVAAGATFATSLRRLDENAEIVMFEKDRDMSFGNCELPYYLNYEIKDSKMLVHRNPESFAKIYNIDARNYHEVISINREEKYVTVHDKRCGEEFNESYDYLILATGASANVPASIKGTDQDHVFTIRNVIDVENIRAYFEDHSPKDIFVAGGGFIAIEAAHALNDLVNVNVRMFVRGKILPVIDDELKPFIEENIIENGVDIIHEQELTEITENEAIFASGRRVPADMVILGLGMRANNQLALDAALDVTDRGSIVTDDNFRTSDPNIFAIGDVTDITNFITGQKQNLKLAWPAHREAKHVAAVLTGAKNIEPLKYIGSFALRSFNLNVAVTGLTEKALDSLGYNYDTTLITHSDIVGIMPEAETVFMKLIFDKDTGKIYGAQALSRGVVDKRIDVVGTLIKMGGTIYDLYDLELVYQPYYATTEDINNVIASQAINVKEGRLPHVRISELADVIDEYEVLDIRNETAYEECHIRGAKLIDGGSVRERCDEIPRDKKVLIYDDVGASASNMLKILNNLGFDNIYMLDGGLVYLRKYDAYLGTDLLCDNKEQS